MAEDAPKTPGKRAGTAAEASLNAALSDLERMLEQRQAGNHGASPSAGLSTSQRAGASPGGRGAGPRAAGMQDRAAPARGAGGDDAQYSIPLLHDVVVPGTDAASVNRRPGNAEAGGEARDDDADEACLKILERLSNEIEVIVQARIEAAAQDAASRIRAEIRSHLEIVLPEIIAELRDLTLDRR